MFNIKTTFAVVVGATALFVGSAAAVDEYGIRCNPGGGALPEDGKLCLAFRSGTEAGDFVIPAVNGDGQEAYVAANGRAMALDCPNEDPKAAGGDFTLYRVGAGGATEPYIILRGQVQSGKHRCCAVQWAQGSSTWYKWCPDMPMVQV